MASLSETRGAKLFRCVVALAGAGIVGLAFIEHGIGGAAVGGVVAGGLIWVSRELTKQSDLLLK